MSTKSKTILIVAAHPDDEVLGVGGTIAKHVANGDAVHILIMAEGATSRNADDRGGVAELRNTAVAVADILGASPPRFAGFPDNKMDSVPLLEIIKEVEKMIDDVCPDVVYVHHSGDLNVDHRICHQAVLTACRPLPGQSVLQLYAFETASSTEWGTNEEAFMPNRFVDISAHFKKKNEALKLYSSEMRPFPHARSFEALDAQAKVRGAASGFKAAEAFMVIREILP